MPNLDSKIVLVTGGARGMGACHARNFVDAGARVVIADVLDDEGRSTASELGENALFVHLDVSSEQSWTDAIEAARSHFGSVTSLVNNAGIELAAPLHETPVEQWDKVIDVNLKGVFLGIKAVIPDMLSAKSGSIVNIGSGAGLIGYENMSAYTSTKAGINGLTKTAAIEYGKHGIRVNALHPGIVQTPMLKDTMDSNADLKQILNDSVKFQAIGRMGETNEISEVISFLLSDRASFVTGVSLPVDGGLILGRATPLA
ncbi:glucose 1-dehydrogenase [Rhodococcus sp. IC4_135]|uniref:glucose 1-dehydrogenase n=1 Tax=Rhodococcus sp. IC4_135 TaxID=2715537 RepID=UPI00142190BB|nr:glucose 1-dehydrogenase [Rhodococcus sp. IC4_135]